MEPKKQIRTIINFLTPETDSWRSLLRTLRIWFCCGMAYGLIAAAIALIKYPTPWDTGILLVLLFVLYAGLKAGLSGTMAWLLFAAYHKVRKRSKMNSGKV